MEGQSEPAKRYEEKLKEKCQKSFNGECLLWEGGSFNKHGYGVINVQVGGPRTPWQK